jgi:hypothetical protein
MKNVLIRRGGLLGLKNTGLKKTKPRFERPLRGLLVFQLLCFLVVVFLTDLAQFPLFIFIFGKTKKAIYFCSYAWVLLFLL